MGLYTILHYTCIKAVTHPRCILLSCSPSSYSYTLQFSLGFINSCSFLSGLDVIHKIHHGCKNLVWGLVQWKKETWPSASIEAKIPKI